MPFEPGNQLAAKTGETNTKRVQLRLKPSQMKRWEAHAWQEGYDSMSEWVRAQCDAATQPKTRTKRRK